MHTRMRSFAGSVVLMLVGLSSFGQLASTTIQGRVHDRSGHAISGVTVEAVPYDFNANLLPTAVTDVDGRYELSCNLTGRLRILAYRENLGYPNTVGIVFTTGNEHFPLIEASAGRHLSNVDIVLGDPDGVISGTIRDEQTGRRVPQARVTLSWAEQPNVMYSSYLKEDGTFLFALPPRPVALEITAPGYKPWHFTNDKSGEAFATLELGSKTHIVIPLEAHSPAAP